MKRVTLKVIFNALILFICFQSRGQSNKAFPKFSWDKVPVAFHFGKQGALTNDEAKFIASHSNYVVLEKGHGLPDSKNTETGIKVDAKKLKELNSNMKVIFYWNAFLDISTYEAHHVYKSHPEWWLKTKEGELDLKKGKTKRYDLSNPEVRKWWVETVKNEISNGSTDGVFMDAFIQVGSPANIELWGQEKYDRIQEGLKKLIAETRAALGNNNLIVYNGIRSNPRRNVGNNFPDYTDAVMIEHFGIINSSSKESMLQDIQEMEKAGKTGKIVIFKGWPGYTWLEKDFMAKPLKEKQEISRKNITFPLASFLAGAQENSYLIYNWGYRFKHGATDWYPEFDKPLGKPLNNMKVNGWELTRDFEHASIWVDLENKIAKIDWK
ncbi:putative glycoside hydrolase [Mariniflexile sp. AS56]|uniref:putative glycoside hydrolase n=1 Tax=Mariniflexile sp. AS56 TaxID=3063957 RepID=UPI0026EE5C24|nr:putative glycoside hydrolase [Mariniflexile sp. AS56]MDO7173694.1 putative glycoside hydrolase [Mariniflexile sp. AS56]